MEYTYYRDLKHNYLVVEDKRDSLEESKVSYQLKILESGRVKGLLPCNIRNINGEKYFYYEINAMQSIKDRFISRGMSYDQLKKMFLDMKAMMEGLTEYLLGDEGLVFRADSIFSDLSGDEFKFMYCPVLEDKMTFGELTEELLDLVDSNDQMANEVIYSLCDYAQTKGTITLEAIDKFFCQTPVMVKEESAPLQYDFETANDYFEDEEDEPITNGNMAKANKRLGGKVQILFAILFAALIGAIIYIRHSYILTSQENMLSLAVMGVSAITGIVSFISGIKDLQGKGKSKEPVKEADKEPLPEKEKEENGWEDKNLFGGDENFSTPIKVTGNAHKQAAAMEATTVLDVEEDFENNLTLYSRNLSKTIRIDLDRLPLTIGKMEECVDKVLNDKTVSRIHCRFFQEEGRLAVIDLNSTNGTYRNGVKLKPQVKTFLGEGDELRIGRICFDCR